MYFVARVRFPEGVKLTEISLRLLHRTLRHRTLRLRTLRLLLLGLRTPNHLRSRSRHRPSNSSRHRNAFSSSLEQYQ